MFQMEKSGLGVKVNFPDLNEENIYNALREVLENKKYTQNIQQVSKLFTIQPQTPLDRAIWWINWVVESPESARLLAVQNYGFFIDFSLDILLFLALCLLLATLLITIIIRKLFHPNIERDKEIEKMKKIN